MTWPHVFSSHKGDYLFRLNSQFCLKGSHLIQFTLASNRYKKTFLVNHTVTLELTQTIYVSETNVLST